MKAVSPPGTPPRRPAGIAAGGEKWSVPFGKPLETMGRKATELRRQHGTMSAGPRPQTVGNGGTQSYVGLKRSIAPSQPGRRNLCIRNAKKGKQV